MQYGDLNLPSQPATDRWLRQTNSREDVIITLPLSFKEDGVPWIFGAVIFSDKAVTMIYNNFLSWNLYTEYPLKYDIKVYNDDLLEPEIGVIREDAKMLQRITCEFAEKIADSTGMGFGPYVDTQAGDRMKEMRKSCSCNSIRDPQVHRAPGLSGIESDRIFMCADCTEIHGLEYEGKSIPEAKATDANWILDGETADEFINTSIETDYLLYSTGDNIGKLEHAIAYLNAVGGGLSSSFSVYVPENHQALVYVKEDELAGYLTWDSNVGGSHALQQLYTRTGYRGQGIASTIITSWVENFCNDNQFYIEKPNKKSRSLFKKLGFFDGRPEAVEHYLLIGVANDFEEGMDRAESVNRTREWM